MILIASAISLFIYFCVFISFPVQYESNAIIYNASPDKKEDNLQLQDGREGFKIINFVYSSDLINHLIKKFDRQSIMTLRQKALMRMLSVLIPLQRILLVPPFGLSKFL